MDRYIDGFEGGDILRDVQTGEFVLLTNGICTLDHSSPEGYADAHTEGCIYRPWEGLVFEGTADQLNTWGLRKLDGREFVKATEADAAKVRAFYERRLNEILMQDRRAKRRAK